MNRPTLYPGNRGKPVLAARLRLAQRGYRTEHPASEFYGQGMMRAVAAFQQRAGLHVDAVIGPKTWAELTHKPGPNAGKTTTAETFALACKRRVTGRDGAGVPSYRLGAEVPNLAVKHPMVLDCSELMQWGVYQAVKDTWVDGSFNQHPACKDIPVARALRTVGATVYLTDDNTRSGTIHHVGVVCQERGTWMVAQARSAYTTPECGIWPADEQQWVLAGLVRELAY